MILTDQYHCCQHSQEYLKKLSLYNYKIISTNIILCVNNCPHENSSSVQARTTKFRQKTHKTLVKIPNNFGVDWPWPSRPNLTGIPNSLMPILATSKYNHFAVDCYMVTPAGAGAGAGIFQFYRGSGRSGSSNRVWGNSGQQNQGK